MQHVNTIMFICGPTCTGKSSFATNLSKEINGVIMNSDAMQVYK
jgi:tRNA A37 N6-isopentenylltransferase MiaA